MNLKVFDFYCERCGLTIEEMVEDREIVECPKCNREMRKCPPSVGLICPTKPGCFSGPAKEGGRKMR